MSENRDRASQLILDECVQSVLEFMQSKIATSKLVSIADSLPQLARLLWAHYPQEPCVALDLVAHLPMASSSRVKPTDATESALFPVGAGGDSVVEAGALGR
jgi:hypothetical protein